MPRPSRGGRSPARDLEAAAGPTVARLAGLDPRGARLRADCAARTEGEHLRPEAGEPGGPRAGRRREQGVGFLPVPAVLLRGRRRRRSPRAGCSGTLTAGPEWGSRSSPSCSRRSSRRRPRERPRVGIRLGRTGPDGAPGRRFGRRLTRLRPSLALRRSPEKNGPRTTSGSDRRADKRDPPCALLCTGKNF